MAKTKTKGTAKTVSDTPVPQPITIRSTNPKIMADNILKLEESIKAADVSANPSGEAEETLLTSIGIDGKKYNIGASAENVSYDNTDSGLTATDAQAAIDEIAGTIQAGVITLPYFSSAYLLTTVMILKSPKAVCITKCNAAKAGEIYYEVLNETTLRIRLSGSGYTESDSQDVSYIVIY